MKCSFAYTTPSLILNVEPLPVGAVLIATRLPMFVVRTSSAWNVLIEELEFDAAV